VSRKSIDDLLEEARAGLVRIDVQELDAAVAAGALVVDTRPVADREAEGAMPGAVVIDRNVLEWRLDPSSAHRIDETGYDRKIVLFCNDGYASSLAAVTLRDLGLDATDLVGGYRAWLAAPARKPAQQAVDFTDASSALQG
jgi:rhodanese-related sulfurtransferase